MIQTERLLLRAWTEEDTEAFFELSQDRGFNLYPITVYTQQSLETARAWVRQAIETFRAEKVYLLPVIELSSGRMIGIAGLRLTKEPPGMPKDTRHEVTYRLRESAWGKGYATEAARAWIDYGFEKLGLDEVAASITPDNEPSKKLALKLGMRKTGDEIMHGVPAEIFRVKRS